MYFLSMGVKGLTDAPSHAPRPANRVHTCLHENLQGSGRRNLQRYFDTFHHSGKGL